MTGTSELVAGGGMSKAMFKIVPCVREAPAVRPPDDDKGAKACTLCQGKAAANRAAVTFMMREFALLGNNDSREDYGSEIRKTEMKLIGVVDTATARRYIQSLRSRSVTTDNHQSSERKIVKRTQPSQKIGLVLIVTYVDSFFSPAPRRLACDVSDDSEVIGLGI